MADTEKTKKEQTENKASTGFPVVKVERDAHGRILPGSHLNPYGSPVGTRAFKTVWRDTFFKIAKNKEITGEEAEKMLLEVGFKAAKRGSFQFWQYLLNRLFPEEAAKDIDLNVQIGFHPTPEMLARAERILEVMEREEDEQNEPR